jgi:sec-independent protein translocase protein TatC
MGLLDSFLSKRNKNPLGEMTFTDHIDDLRGHIIRSILVILVFAIVSFVNIEWIFQHIIFAPSRPGFISNIWMCKIAKQFSIEGLCMEGFELDFQNTQLSGQFMMSFSSSFMIGFILAFPYVFWEFWKFIKPALKPGEIKQARGVVFWSSLLFFLGVLFAYYVIAPFTISFFATYTLSPNFKNNITISSYYDNMSDIVLGMGIVFELPIVVYFLSRVGVITPKFMRDKRRYAVLILLILATVITPPDMLSCWFVFLPLYMLYEISIVMSARVQRAKVRKELSQ